jgi:hypothetical protein
MQRREGGRDVKVDRRLFRAWIGISALWIIAGGVFAFQNVSATLWGNFKAVVLVKKGIALEKDSKTLDAPMTSDFYDIVILRDKDKLNIEFVHVDKPPTQSRLLRFPDGARLYVRKGYNEAERNYVAQQFWGQRWSRWGYAAGIVALWAFIPGALFFILKYVPLWL